MTTNITGDGFTIPDPEERAARNAALFADNMEAGFWDNKGRPAYRILARRHRRMDTPRRGARHPRPRTATLPATSTRRRRRRPVTLATMPLVQLHICCVDVLQFRCPHRN
jgi:hypothetical protein